MYALKWKMSEWKRDKIRYFYKENGGKCSAINYGIKKAKGELTKENDNFVHFVKSRIRHVEDDMI